MKKLPHLRHEKKLWEKGYHVIGIDEVGRGAFAGPLVIGGIIFSPTTSRSRVAELLSLGINDSKKLKKAEREKIDLIVKKESFAHICESVSVSTINSVGIGKAFQIGVRSLVKSLKKKNYDRKFFLLVDAFYIKYVRGIGLRNQKAIIHGDEISLSIAAASIVAKVYRDKVMARLSKKYPQYGFDRHVGYGTREHREALKNFGILTVHRRAFVAKTIDIL